MKTKKKKTIIALNAAYEKWFGDSLRAFGIDSDYDSNSDNNLLEDNSTLTQIFFFAVFPIT